MVSWTVTRRPFQSPVALAMSSPTFLGDCERANHVKPSEQHLHGRVSKATHKTQGTDLGSKSGGRTDFTTGGPEVDDLYDTERKSNDQLYVPWSSVSCRWIAKQAAAAVPSSSHSSESFHQHIQQQPSSTIVLRPSLFSFNITVSMTFQPTPHIR
jgi:hypothetical protein